MYGFWSSPDMDCAAGIAGAAAVSRCFRGPSAQHTLLMGADERSGMALAGVFEALLTSMLPIGARVRAVARAMQEQQLLARQMVLQQQAASAVAAASKTQREVRAAPPESDTLSVIWHAQYIWATGFT